MVARRPACSTTRWREIPAARSRVTPVGRSGGRDSTPPWWCDLRPCTPKLASDASRAVGTLAGRSAGPAPTTHRTDIKRSTAWIATLRGPELAQQSSACGLHGPRDRNGWSSRSTPAGPVRRKKRGPKTQKRRFHTPVRRRRTGGLRRGPRSSTACSAGRAVVCRPTADGATRRRRHAAPTTYPWWSSHGGYRRAPLGLPAQSHAAGATKSRCRNPRPCRGRRPDQRPGNSRMRPSERM